MCATSGQDPQFSNIIFKINKLDLLWVSNFIALGIYFIFGTKFFWNEGNDTCFNVECVLLGRYFDFLGGYCSLPSCYCSLLGGYCSFPLLVWTNRNPFFVTLLVWTNRNPFFVLSVDLAKASQDTDMPTKIIEENADIFQIFFFQLLIIESELSHSSRGVHSQIKHLWKLKINYGPVSMLRNV